jgi:hypothetical protein
MGWRGYNFGETRVLSKNSFVDSELLLNTSQPTMKTTCKHPKVRVVAREEDTEFVECQECGEVFDSDEFRDMAIEEAVDEEKEI